MIPRLVQWVKDLALLQLWHGLQFQLRFSLWPWNCHMLPLQPKKRKQNKNYKIRYNMTQMNLSTEQKQMHIENRLVVAKVEGEGWFVSLRLADINYYT